MFRDRRTQCQFETIILQFAEHPTEGLCLVESPSGRGKIDQMHTVFLQVLPDMRVSKDIRLDLFAVLDHFPKIQGIEQGVRILDDLARIVQVMMGKENRRFGLPSIELRFEPTKLHFTESTAPFV